MSSKACLALGEFSAMFHAKGMPHSRLADDGSPMKTPALQREGVKSSMWMVCHVCSLQGLVQVVQLAGQQWSRVTLRI